MPTIKTRKQTDGATRYTAIARIRRGGVILRRESRTFAHRDGVRYRPMAVDSLTSRSLEREKGRQLPRSLRPYICFKQQPKG